MSSPVMHDLFAAARSDAPTDLVRDEVWGRVAAATAVPTAAAVAAKAVAPAGGKLIAIGALIGAAGATAALTLASGLIEPSRVAPAERRTPSVVASGHAAGAVLAQVEPRRRVRHDPAPVIAPAAPVPRAEHAEHVDTASALAEEARQVTDARAALMKGEPERALASVRSTHRLTTRSLEPEELALEVRALRALGRTDEALATELTLRRRYPSHSLSR